MDKTAGIEHTFHRTKIVATVGPACDTYEKLLELVKAGVNVFRLNFSHGAHEDKARIIEYIRQINITNRIIFPFWVICKVPSCVWVKWKAAALMLCPAIFSPLPMKNW